MRRRPIAGRGLAIAPIVAVGLLAGNSACMLVTMGAPRPRAGRLTMPDGRPVANADVVVETWRLMTPGLEKGELQHTFRTKTDPDGRWSVPGRATLAFTVALPDLPPVNDDEYTFQAPAGGPTLHHQFFPSPTRRFRPGPAQPPDEVVPDAMAATFDGPHPVSVYLLPVFGIAGGDGQKLSGHVGGLLLVSRGFGAGVRADIQPGITGISASAGIVVVPFREALPFPGIELSARVLRPWAESATRRAELEPELGIDLVNLRFTFTALRGQASAPPGQRGYLIGVGFGYF